VCFVLLIHRMDLLKKELERKKRALEDAKKSESAAVGRKYLKAGDLRRMQEEREEAERLNPKKLVEGREETKRRRTEGREEKRLETGAKSNENSRSKKVSSEQEGLNQQIQDASQLSSGEISQRFRAMGLPVLLFGERLNGDSPRMDRLRKALVEHKETLASLTENEEFRLASEHATRNAFLEKDEDEKQAAVASDSKEKQKEGVKEDDGEDLTKDPHKRIYKYFKGLLKQWEDDLALRPEDVKRTAAGKTETKTLKQCKDYIRPLFKLCKNRTLEESLMTNIIKIIDFCEEGEFVKAHDAYLDIAIGRAPWPIGVTQVGIHARTGRAKIESQNVAHVMNSELQRKYLTSIKRLMTFAQNKRSDVLHSKKVIN